MNYRKLGYQILFTIMALATVIVTHRYLIIKYGVETIQHMIKNFLIGFFILVWIIVMIFVGIQASD